MHRARQSFFIARAVHPRKNSKMGGYLGRWFYSNSGDNPTDSDTHSVGSDTHSVSSDTSYMSCECDASNLQPEVTTLNFKPATSRSVQSRHVMMFTASTRTGGSTDSLCCTKGVSTHQIRKSHTACMYRWQNATNLTNLLITIASLHDVRCYV